MSTVSRSPAVSTNRIGIPRTFNNSSKTSRVVPGISETIARSVRKRAFNKLDFPTLGHPIIATRAPSRMILPSSNVLSNWSRWPCISRSAPSNSLVSIKVMSSSTKSIPASRRARWWINWSRMRSTSLDKVPRNWACAALRLLVVVAWIVSRTASAWARSSRPFKKARLVNSPGLASRAPFRISAPQVV